MEKGASTPWKSFFDSEYEMLSIMNDVLARQKGDKDIRHVLTAIRGGEHYFFDVDLTFEQAESLGFRKTDDYLVLEEVR